MRYKLMIILMQLLFLAAVLWAMLSCQKQPIREVNAAPSSSSLKIKLVVWYQCSDSIQVSPAHPCGTVTPGFTKFLETWYECNKPTGNVHWITAQQTGNDALKQDSLQFSFYMDGHLVNQVSGKKLLTASYTY